MPDRTLQYRRVHNLLLLQKHLTLREGSSPFTLILDSVEQPASSLIKRYIHNAKVSSIDTIYISYETLRPPPGIIHFIKARRKDLVTLQKEVSAITSTSKRTLVVIDTLYPLITTTNSSSPSLPTFLSSLLTASPTSTTLLLAIHHTDIPLPPTSGTPSPYAPHPLSLLRYLATTILTCHSLPQMSARKRAAERSQPEPVFGLAEGRDGVVVGLLRGAGTRGVASGKGGGGGGGGVVLEAEFRRKSGRAVEEWFFLPAMHSNKEDGGGGGGGAKIMLLDDHPEYNHHPSAGDDGAGSPSHESAGGGTDGASTFDLGLTERQRRDREGVVLPYFDAQRGVLGEGGEGGRILYDLGVEDDFDEEEDEI